MPPAACYLAMRLLGMLLWWGMATLNDRPVDPRAWDGHWYTRIAEYGYLEAEMGMIDTHGQPTPKGAMAFFPGYPLLVRLVAPLFAHNYLAAALTQGLGIVR